MNDPRIKHIRYIKDYEYMLGFSDGYTGIVDFLPMIFGKAFEEIENVHYFRMATISPLTGTITWPNGVDIAPETLYLHVKDGQKLAKKQPVSEGLLPSSHKNI